MEQDTLLEFLLEIISELVGNALNSSVNYGTIIENSYAVGSKFIEKAGIVSIAESFIPIAISLLAIRWAIALMQDILTKDFDIEVIVRSLMRLVIAAIIVTNSIKLAQGTVQFGDALFGLVSESVGELEFGLSDAFKDLAELAENAEGDSTTTGLIGVITAIMAAYLQPIISLIITFILYVHGWSRSIAITQTFMYAPIGLSDCYRLDARSGAVNYMRKLLALIAEPIFVVVGIKAYIVFASSPGDIVSGNDAIIPWLQFIFVLAMIAFIRGAKKMSEEIFT